MGLGGVAIAALPTVIFLKVPFSDGLGGVVFRAGTEPRQSDSFWISYQVKFVSFQVSRSLIAYTMYTIYNSKQMQNYTFFSEYQNFQRDFFYLAARLEQSTVIAVAPLPIKGEVGVTKCQYEYVSGFLLRQASLRAERGRASLIPSLLFSLFSLLFSWS